MCLDLLYTDTFPFSPFFSIFLSFFMKATVECYNPRTNEWTYVAKMNEPHYGHAGTVYGGYMYISGKTLPRDTCQSGVQCEKKKFFSIIVRVKPFIFENFQETNCKIKWLHFRLLHYIALNSSPEFASELRWPACLHACMCRSNGVTFEKKSI